MWEMVGALVAGVLGGAGTVWGVVTTASRKKRQDTIDQAAAFNDRLLRYQDRLRAEVLVVYDHLHDCRDNESRMAGHIGYLEDRLDIPAENRWRSPPRTPLVVPEFLRTPIPANAEEFIRRSNEQDREVLKGEAELHRSGPHKVRPPESPADATNPDRR